MGLFTLTIAGSGFILIGAWEALTSSIQSSTPNPEEINLNSSSPGSPVSVVSIKKTNPGSKNLSSSSSLTFLAAAIVAFLSIVNCLLSLLSALNSRDRIGSPLQLQVLAIAALFGFYAVLGLVSKVSAFIRFPSVVLDLVLLFAFVEEFLLFYSQKKDASGIENRYFDLMLVPISVCVVSTLLELKSPSNYVRLARGVGLILHGMWFVQMGISFYTNLIVQGCVLREKSRGNYTIKCKGHPEYHRARGIATLQFNCHLALLVVVATVAYAILAKKYGDRVDLLRYKPLGAEMQQMENDGQFTLDSDSDEIGEEENVASEMGATVKLEVNGYGSHG